MLFSVTGVQLYGHPLHASRHCDPRGVCGRPPGLHADLPLQRLGMCGGWALGPGGGERSTAAVPGKARNHGEGFRISEAGGLRVLTFEDSGLLRLLGVFVILMLRESAGFRLRAL